MLAVLCAGHPRANAHLFARQPAPAPAPRASTATPVLSKRHACGALAWMPARWRGVPTDDLARCRTRLSPHRSQGHDCFRVKSLCPSFSLSRTPNSPGPLAGPPALLLLLPGHRTGITMAPPGRPVHVRQGRSLTVTLGSRSRSHHHDDHRNNRMCSVAIWGEIFGTFRATNCRLNSRHHQW